MESFISFAAASWPPPKTCVWARGAAPAHAAVGATSTRPVVGGRPPEHRTLRSNDAGGIPDRGRIDACPARRALCSIKSRPSKGGTVRSGGARNAGASGSARWTTRPPACFRRSWRMSMRKYPDIAVRLLEEKTIKLLPKILPARSILRSFGRRNDRTSAPSNSDRCFRSAVVAIPEKHPLARRKSVSLRDLAEEPLIVPDRRSRPHGHDLTIKLFEGAGLARKIAKSRTKSRQIVNLVAARLARLSCRAGPTPHLTIPGVRFVPLKVAKRDRSQTAPRRGVVARLTRSTRDAIWMTLRRGWTGLSKRPWPRLLAAYLFHKRPVMSSSCHTGASGNGRNQPDRTRWPNRPAAPAICAKRS